MGLLAVMDNMEPTPLSADALEDLFVSGFMGQEDYEGEEDLYLMALNHLGMAIAALRNEDVLRGEKAEIHFKKAQAKSMRASFAQANIECATVDKLIEEGSCGLYNDFYPSTGMSSLSRLARAEAQRCVHVHRDLQRMYNEEKEKTNG